MTVEWTTPLTVEQMCGEWDVEWNEAMALTDRSLDPRPKTSICDTLSTLGPRRWKLEERVYTLTLDGT
ncbi:MAG: hypothetical protein MUQ27_13150 [Acidimicrobiia bacterium]|nr:hypothetical protein [Acidimicrobiia bacterium]